MSQAREQVTEVEFAYSKVHQSPDHCDQGRIYGTQRKMKVWGIFVSKQGKWRMSASQGRTKIGKCVLRTLGWN